MIYFDNNATTALDPSVFAAMQLDLAPFPYNPSSITYYGRKAKAILMDAKRQIADFLHVSPHELYFTSGATEANNWIINGFFRKQKKKIIITSSIEHPSVTAPIANLQTEVYNLPINQEGSPSMEALSLYLEKNSEQVAFIFLSLANSETGVILDYEKCSEIALKYGIPLLLDGVQSLGKMDLSILPGVTAMTFSAHKCHGPKGIGLLYLKKGKIIPPWILGGGQQDGMRGGTENLSGILGFAKAIELINKGSQEKMRQFINLIETKLLEISPMMKIHGGKNRISNTTNIYFPSSDGENLLILLEKEGLIVSLGSACSAGSLQPSTVLLGMGLSPEEAKNSIRISLSRMTQEAEIHRAIAIISKLL